VQLRNIAQAGHVMSFAGSDADDFYVGILGF
jgi:hypothetical protein